MLRFRRLVVGFTLVEIIIAISIVAILATIGVVAYNGIQERSVRATLYKDLASAADAVEVEAIGRKSLPSDLPDSYRASDGVTVRFGSDLPRYSGLTAVQNGVLFYETCLELIANPTYSLIHPKDGGTPQSVVMRCDDNIHAGGLLITGWQSITWSVPVTTAKIQAYIDGVPYDSWWIDRQDVIRGFYTELMNRFEARGGTWPVSSFWDPWANQWSGVHKEELPELTSSGDESFCVEAFHERYPDITYHLKRNGKQPIAGSCG